MRILSPLIISGLAFGLRLNDPIFVRQNIHPGHLFFREKAYKTQTDRRKNTFLIAGRYIVVGRLDCVSTGIRTFTSSALLSLPNTIDDILTYTTTIKFIISKTFASFYVRQSGRHRGMNKAKPGENCCLEISVQRSPFVISTLFYVCLFLLVTLLIPDA